MYLWLKLIHILAVVMFIGNVVTGVFWHRHALATRDARLIAHAMDGVIRSDRLFTVPGVVLIIASGVFAAIQGGFPILGTPWILWTLVLFGISGAVFGMKLAPLQRQMRAHAQVAAHAARSTTSPTTVCRGSGISGARSPTSHAAPRPRTDGAEAGAVSPLRRLCPASRPGSWLFAGMG